MKNQRSKTIVGAAVLALLAFAISFTRLLYPVDKMLSDPLYQKPSAVNPRIKIIAIDERTLAQYGDVSTWSRDVYAQLTETLNENPAIAPAVIAYDILCISDKDAAGDDAFARAAAQGGNVVMAVNLVHRDKGTVHADGTYTVEEDAIDMVEYPYAALAASAKTGFANTLQDSDGYIRFAQTKVDYNGEVILSFAAQIYETFCERTGLVPAFPKTAANDTFGFTYTGVSHSYEIDSMADVLEGRIPAAAFANAIVLVGAYAPGMQDAYNVAVQRGAQMYGVEIHANILQALMDGKTALPVSPVAYALAAALLAALFWLACSLLKPQWSALVLVGAVALCAVGSTALYRGGIIVPLLDIPVFLVLAYGVQLVRSYMLERQRRKKVTGAFKQYVAPQVVEQIAKKGEYELKLGGENRDIAVLFVDIRGFTPMSEGLQPEEVVEILNEYLSLTTNSIFKNGGTLDKFIGDATMAVFNAPFDLDDYIYRAVCTARDIAAGSDALKEKFMARFGKTVSFGIGVNCGPAVVGNIGCDFRMDYTAIGDTVNTAARLESNAKAGQILISDAVYSKLKDRLEVTEIGVIPLKGKSNEIFVYQVDKVK